MAKGTKARSRLTAQGQISVPAPVREKLGLTAGSILEWDAEGDRVTVRRTGRNTSAQVHAAVFGKPPVARDLEALKAGVRRYVRARRARD